MSLLTNMDQSVLEPPPNGEATFSIKVEEPLDIEEGNLVELEAVVQVVESSSNRHKRFLIGRQDRGNHLQMIMNEKIICDKEVDETAGKFQRIKSEKTQYVKNPVVQVLQTSGDNPVALSVSGLGFVKSETPTKEPNRPVVIPNTEPNSGSQETEEPAKKPPAPPEATGEEPAPDNQETNEPAPEPAAPPEVSMEEPPLVGDEITVQPPQQRSPPDVVETEPVPGTLETAPPSEPARSDGGTIITEQRPETGTGIAPVISTGNPPESVPATPTGPVEVRPNEAAHRIVTSMVVLYGVSVLAALLV